MVMEFCPSSLAERFLNTPTSVEDINLAFEQILAGVAYMHGEGFAHGDLKLENIIVGVDGAARLIDFGTAIPTASSDVAEFCVYSEGDSSPSMLRESLS